MGKLIACVCMFGVALTPMLVEFSVRSSGVMSDAELNSIVGAAPDPGSPCGDCTEIDAELCEGEYGESGVNNDCDWVGCITLGNAQDDTPCGLVGGDNRKYTGDTIVRTEFDPLGEGNREPFYDTGSTHLCDYRIVCVTGTTYHSVKSCQGSPGVCTRDTTLPVKGCRTCSGGSQTDPLSHHSLEDHECVDCPDPIPGEEGNTGIE